MRNHSPVVQEISQLNHLQTEFLVDGLILKNKFWSEKMKMGWFLLKQISTPIIYNLAYWTIEYDDFLINHGLIDQVAYMELEICCNRNHLISIVSDQNSFLKTKPSANNSI